MKFKTNLKTSTALIDLTPLVDVIFLLLIFFIVTSDILPLKSLNIENPTLSQDSTPLTTQLVLVVDAQQVIYVGSKKEIVDLDILKDHLQSHLKELAKQNGGQAATLVLSIDRRVDYGLFLKLLATAQECCPRIRLAYQHVEETYAEN
jgi:biopolymer transport protein ExbD